VPAWDDIGFVQQMGQATAQQDQHAIRALLKSVSRSNYDLTRSCYSREVPRTVRVSSSDARQRVQGHGREPRYSISGLGTGDALLLLARQLAPAGRTVCALNFANGQHIGGGYLTGASAQEEELCRQFPTLYTSLKGAADFAGGYPFGPSTLRGPGDPGGYADVLLTGGQGGGLVARRANRAQGYRILDEDTEVLDNITLVSAAAPNVKQREVFDAGLVRQAMRTIMVAPRLHDRRVDAIVLGAWGCGAFGCDPHVMAQLFAEVLVQDGLGRLYREVHFAIPPSENADAFEQTLTRAGLNLRRS